MAAGRFLLPGRPLAAPFEWLTAVERSAAPASAPVLRSVSSTLQRTDSMWHNPPPWQYPLQPGQQPGAIRLQPSQQPGTFRYYMSPSTMGYGYPMQQLPYPQQQLTHSLPALQPGRPEPLPPAGEQQTRQDTGELARLRMEIEHMREVQKLRAENERLLAATTADRASSTAPGRLREQVAAASGAEEKEPSPKHVPPPAQADKKELTSAKAELEQVKKELAALRSDTTAQKELTSAKAELEQVKTELAALRSDAEALRKETTREFKASWAQPQPQPPRAQPPPEPTLPPPEPTPPPPPPPPEPTRNGAVLAQASSGAPSPLKARTPQHASEVQREKRFTADEMLAMAVHARLDFWSKDRLRSLMSVFDQTGDGVLSRSEFDYSIQQLKKLVEAVTKQSDEPPAELKLLQMRARRVVAGVVQSNAGGKGHSSAGLPKEVLDFTPLAELPRSCRRSSSPSHAAALTRPPSSSCARRCAASPRSSLPRFRSARATARRVRTSSRCASRRSRRATRTSRRCTAACGR